MAVTVKIVHPRDFIRTNVDGALDLEASRKLLVSIASLIEKPRQYHLLVDTRQAQAHLTVGDLFELGVAVTSFPAIAQSMTAVLAPVSEEEKARFMELVARNRGALLRVFTSFEEAITWILMEDTRDA
jgi:hypothetical protein